ncbi:MAG TPA: ferrous iron transporter B [Armatimonadota bacterium]|nr:ferrous iron transporter B [Armatimonadota bacterium]
MKRVLLVGNPNVGKSVVFSRLTGARVIASNYPGSTVEFAKGRMKLDDSWGEVVDAPGTYSLEPTSRAEEVAVGMLADGDVVINVIDATNLERNLYLTLQLLKCGKPVVIALNMFDETGHKGIQIDVGKLEDLLGVPVVPTCALSGEGIKELMSRLQEAKANSLQHDNSTRWCLVGEIVQQVQRMGHHHHTPLEALADLSLRPWTGIPLSILVALACFETIRLIGEGLIGYLLDPLFESYWRPLVMKLSSLIGGGTHIHDLLIGNPVHGRIDFGQSMGLLTTGLYVPLAMVLPYVVAFYLVLSILEDVGYLPRLGVLMDTIMHRLGLHGLAVIPMLLGLGCNVPGALSTRVFETRRQRFVTATLMAICVPCMAQTAMVIGLLGKFGATGLMLVFGTLAILWLILAVIFRVTAVEESPEIFLEIPPYRIPSVRAVAQKLWLRTRQFIVEAVPYVLLGVLIVNLLHSLRVIQVFGHLASPILTTILGLPEEAISALLVGFLRKDVAVGMLAPMGLDKAQLVVASVVLASYFPCVATFAVLLREFGPKDMLKAAGVMVLVALIAGGLLNLIL